MTIGERFVTNGCSPVLEVKNPTAGSITRSSIAHLTATQLDALFKEGGLFADLDAWFLHQIEMQACGVVRYAFYDWLYANADRVDYRAAMTAEKVVGGPSLLHPFVIGTQESIQNKDYWRVVNGAAANAQSYTVDTPATGKATMTAGPLTAFTGGTRIIRVDNRYGMPMDAAWFRSRTVVHIFGRGEDGSTLNSAYKVIDAATDTALTYIDVLLADQNAGSDASYDAAPTSGVILHGINNVNDFESWCVNKPTVDPRKRVLFWYQTRRWGRKIDSEYEAVYKRLVASNAAFREFGDLPMAQVNAQDELMERRAFVLAFLFNKPISANQTAELWQSLEAINTTAGDTLNVMSGKIVARRANFVGVKEQLRLCDRVIDLKGGVLNWAEFELLCYDLVRARKGSGKRQVTDLDWWVNSTFAVHIKTAMLGPSGYYSKYYHNFTTNWEITHRNDELGIMYDSYLIHRPGGVKINFLYDYSWDDLLDQFTDQGIESAGNMMVCLDIGKKPNGSMFWAQLAANRKVYQTATIEELAKYDATYRCTMATLGERVTLNSETGMPVVECPLNSAWIDGVAMEPPDVAAAADDDRSDLL